MDKAFLAADGIPSISDFPEIAGLEKTSFLVTDGIRGIAAKDEIIRVNDHGILIGRWLPISKYSQLMKSRHLLHIFSLDKYSPPTREPRQPRG